MFVYLRDCLSGKVYLWCETHKSVLCFCSYPVKTPKEELGKKIHVYIFNAKVFVLSLLSSCEFVIRRRSSFYFFCVECPKGHPYYIGDVSILWSTSKRALHGVADDIRNLVTSFLGTIRKTLMYISFAFSCKVVPNFSNCSWDWRGLHLNQIYTFADWTSWSGSFGDSSLIPSTRRTNLLAPETWHFYCLDIHSKTAETGFFPEDFSFGELPLLSPQLRDNQDLGSKPHVVWYLIFVHQCSVQGSVCMVSYLCTPM